MFFCYCYAHHLDLHSFPTRRSSDLCLIWRGKTSAVVYCEKKSSRNPNAPPMRAMCDNIHWHSAYISRSSFGMNRSEEHTSELQSRGHLVCRLLLEKKKTRETREVNR